MDTADFEYPSTVAILLREIKYGIEIGFNHTTVNPLLAQPGQSFSYHVGNVHVDYKPTGLTRIRTPGLLQLGSDVDAPDGGGGGERRYRLHGMQPGGQYTVAAATTASTTTVDQLEVSTAATDEDGVLDFTLLRAAAGGVDVQFVG